MRRRTTKPFDATMKQLVEARPRDYLALLGFPGTQARMIDVDLATITTEADRVLRVEDGPAPYIAHIEFQSGREETLPDRLLRYNVLLRYRHALPVHSAVVLLRREADHPNLTGSLEYHRADGSRYLSFEYAMTRLWTLPAEEVLAGGWATLPLALLGDVAEGDLPDIVRQMETRIAGETTPEQAKMLWAATYILLGLKYPANFATELLKGVRQMKESSTYQAILAEGRAEGLTTGRAQGERDVILRLGRKRFGPPPAEVEAALAAVTSVERLGALAERLLEVESWEEFRALL